MHDIPRKTVRPDFRILTLTMSDECFTIFGCLVAVTWITGCLLFIYFGATEIDIATKWGDEMTKETCYIIDRTQKECTYYCNCDDDDGLIHSPSFLYLFLLIIDVVGVDDADAAPPILTLFISGPIFLDPPKTPPLYPPIMNR